MSTYKDSVLEGTAHTLVWLKRPVLQSDRVWRQQLTGMASDEKLTYSVRIQSEGKSLFLYL